jgi:hypothetical protein
MANKFYTGFETENIHQEYECSQCLETITNPVCHECLKKAILQWLSFYPNVRKRMAPKIKSYSKQVNNLVMNSINCVSCSNKKAALCPYCFTEGVYNLLKKSKIDLNVIGDFLSVFNFDLKHEGYVQEAIEQGIY